MVGRGEEGPPCDPGSELLLGKGAREKCEDNEWDGKKERKKKYLLELDHDCS